MPHKTKLIEHIKDYFALNKRLVELSNKKGGAWVAARIPFSHETHLYQYASPSKVPDYFMDSHDPFRKSMIAYKGKLQPFTKSAQIREQNRGLGRD